MLRSIDALQRQRHEDRLEAQLLRAMPLNYRRDIQLAIRPRSDRLTRFAVELTLLQPRNDLSSK